MLCACALTLAAFLQHPKESFLAKNTVPKPNLKAAVEYSIPAPDDNPKYHVLKIKLPKSSKLGKHPWVFDGPLGGIVSVRVEKEGKDAENVVLQQLLNTEIAYDQGAKMDGLVVADSWFGSMEPYEFQMDKSRTGEVYVLLRGEPYVVYSMLASWPNGNVSAREEAMNMAKYVIWTAKSSLPADKAEPARKRKVSK